MKQVYKIGDSEQLNSSQAVLLIEVGDRHCWFGIVDYANFMLVEFVYYSSEKSGNGETLKAIVERHAELGQSFRQTVVGYYTPENILVPSRFYRYEETQQLLASTYEKGHNVVISESIPEWQLYNVYYVPAATHGLLSRRFATGHFWHVYSILLKNSFPQAENGNLLVDFKIDSFSVVVVRNRALTMAQIFWYTKPADVLYWLLKICSQFSISQDEVRVVLSGLVDRQSSLMSRLNQYFVNIDFATVENDVRLSTAFDDYPVHFFSSLYKLASCVS